VTTLALMNNASLMPSSRNLHDQQWCEYDHQNGMGGGNTAWLISILKYHRRKVVWDLVSAGRTTDLVSDLMYGVWQVNKRIKYNQWLAC
jgi:hypothetical protein